MAWFDEFFDEHYLDYWARMLDEERTDREVRFVAGQLDLPAGSAILDLCCGQARHAIALAKLGYRLTGFDLNSFLIDAARKYAADAGADIRLVQGDMREIPFEAEFDAALNLFTAFGYFEDESENQRVLEGVARALKPGGKFLIDQSHVLRAVRDFQPRVWQRYPDGTTLIEERRLDARTMRYGTRATYIKPDGTRAERQNDIRCYTCAELSAMLRAAGLEVTGVFGDFEGAELTLDSKRLVILSQKSSGC